MTYWFPLISCFSPFGQFAIQAVSVPDPFSGLSQEGQVLRSVFIELQNDMSSKHGKVRRVTNPVAASGLGTSVF